MNAASIVSVITAYGVVFLYLLALYVEKGERPFRRTRRGFRRLPAWEKTFLALFVGAWIAFASVKEGTNDVDQVEGDTNTVSGLLTQGSFGRPNPAPGTTPAITDEDIARKWRISSTTDAGRLAAPTANAVTNAAWCDYGGMSDAMRIKPVGWCFPYGDKATVGLTVFQNGDFRPNVKTRFFPRPFDANLSLLPRLNWRLLPDGGESVFWHEHTPSNSLILTWHNALYNRDANCPTNFQAELFADGRFDYRYPDRTVRYVPVFPFDWDGDGLENSVDPDPQTANLIDAHDTNDEWRRIVCSNVFENVGGIAAFRGDVNTNAYYYVEVCAERGPAPIYFNADRTSRLGSPVIVANGGVTNHVPLLIGVEYVVTSTVPISVAAPDAQCAVVTENDERSYAVKWPLDAVFTEGYSGSNRTYTISFTPYDPGGTFTWDEAPSPYPRPLLLGASGGPACGCVTCSGNTVMFGCTPNCTCHGDCRATGGYYYENAMFAITGGVCRCGFDDPDPSPPETPGEDVATPSFSIRFSCPAVIFEDAYTNSPGDVVARRSTRAMLSVFASGGVNGGSFELGSQNIGRLVSDDGSVVQLPSGGTLAPHESFSWTCICEGAKASTREDDIEVSGYFIENETGELLSDNGSLTSLKIIFQPYELVNDCPNRHIVGVRENCICIFEPQDMRVSANSHGSGDIISRSGYMDYLAPIEGDCPVLCFICSSVVYPLCLEVIEPSLVSVRERINKNVFGAWENHAGRIGMNLKLFVLPTNVSFSGIAVMEIPDEYQNVTGYFTAPIFSPYWSHTTNNGAGEWHNVQVRNFFLDDNADMNIDLPMAFSLFSGVASGGWIPGQINWRIPVGWNERNSAEDDMPLKTFATYWQQFVINRSGTLKIQKLGHWVERGTNDIVHIDGERR